MFHIDSMESQCIIENLAPNIAKLENHSLFRWSESVLVLPYVQNPDFNYTSNQTADGKEKSRN